MNIETINTHRAALYAGLAQLGGKLVDQYLEYLERTSDRATVILWPADHPKTDVLVAPMDMPDCFALTPVSDAGFDALFEMSIGYEGNIPDWFPVDRRELKNLSDDFKAVGVRMGKHEGIVTLEMCKPDAVEEDAA